MVNVGGTHYRRIDNHPYCAADGCRKRAERRGGILTSAWCLEHTRDELARLIDAGHSYGAARQAIWEGRPSTRLIFVR